MAGLFRAAGSLRGTSRRRIGVYCPAPLHWIFRAARECIRRIRLALRAPTIECAEVFEMQRRHRHREHLAQEYSRGYLHGWHECFHVCLETVEEEATRASNLWDIGDLLSATPPKLPRKN